MAPRHAKPTVELEDAARRLAGIAADTAALAPVSGTYRAGGNASEWRAWFDGDRLVLIEERVASEDLGISRGRYGFAGGRLFYYARVDRRSPGAPPPNVLTTRFAYDSAGTLRAHEKTVEGRLLRLTAVEARMVARHAARLAADARRARTGRALTDSVRERGVSRP